MRNVLLIAMAVVLLAACKKRYCWQCETEITTTVVSQAKDTSYIYDSKSDMLCDRTEKEIRKDEEANSTEAVIQDNGQTIYRKLDMKCEK